MKDRKIRKKGRTILKNSETIKKNSIISHIIMEMKSKELERLKRRISRKK
jgi:hypothetical protein